MNLVNVCCSSCKDPLLTLEVQSSNQDRDLLIHCKHGQNFSKHLDVDSHFPQQLPPHQEEQKSSGPEDDLIVADESFIDEEKENLTQEEFVEDAAIERSPRYANIE